MRVYSFLDLFKENAQVLAKKYNLEYTTELNLENAGTYVIFGCHHADYAYKLLTYHYRYSLNYVIINSEQSTSNTFKNNYYIKLLSISKVVDYNYISANFITTNFNIPVSVSYFFDYNVKLPNKSKKYDILFTGTKNEKRDEIMNNLIEKYKDKNIFYGNNISPLKISTLLVDTKIVLNIPYYPDGILEIHRIHQALAAGCIVLSSRGKDLEQNKLYEDYIYFTDDFNTVDYESLVPKKSYEELQSILYSKFKFNNCILEKMGKMKIDNKNCKIIVARYNENIDWTNYYNDIIIYNKGNKIDNSNIINVENVGRETHTYFKYIVDHYDNLRYEYYIFLQGYPFDHSPNLHSKLNDYINNFNLNIDFDNISEYIYNFNFKNGDINHPGLPLTERYIKIFGSKPVDNTYYFGAGAQFIVSKNAILKRPKTFYENILNMVDKDVCPIEAYVLERFYPIIFNN